MIKLREISFSKNHLKIGTALKQENGEWRPYFKFEISIFPNDDPDLEWTASAKKV